MFGSPCISIYAERDQWLRVITSSTSTQITLQGVGQLREIPVTMRLTAMCCFLVDAAGVQAVSGMRRNFEFSRGIETRRNT
jgi:hypothetical protein